MFESGDYSDLNVTVIGTDTTYKVHKCVLNAASDGTICPLYDSDTLNFVEADATVKAILHHCYGIDVELITNLQTDGNEPACIAGLDLYRAAHEVCISLLTDLP